MIVQAKPEEAERATKNPITMNRCFRLAKDAKGSSPKEIGTSIYPGWKIKQSAPVADKRN